jgi:hypothetical protein
LRRGAIVRRLSIYSEIVSSRSAATACGQGIQQTRPCGFIWAEFPTKSSIGDARFQFNLGLGADPKNADLRLALADLEIMSGVPEAARADAQYLLRADPQNRGALEILNRTGGKTQPQ